MGTIQKLYGLLLRNPEILLPRLMHTGLKSLMTELCRLWKKTKDNISKYYDQYHQPQPEYEEGDEVLLNAKNIRTVQPTKKLAPKLYEPFQILAKIGKSAYRLEL
jgi:hypothetical protein